MREQRVVLEDRVDVALVRRDAGDRRAGEQDLAFGRLLEAGDHPQRRGLAAARRPEQARELAARDAQVHVVDGHDVAEPLRDADDLDIGGGCGERSRFAQSAGGPSVVVAGDGQRGPLGRMSMACCALIAVAGLQARCMVRAPESSVNAERMRISHAPAPGRASIASVCTYTSETELVAGANMATQLELGRASARPPGARLTLRDVSERAGVTESFLSQVERDVTSPSIATLQRIARALDLVDRPAVRRGARDRACGPT